MEGVCDEVRALNLPHAHNPPLQRVTLSMGVTVFRGPQPVERVVAEADRALYAAKHAGRDRVVVTPPPGTSL